MIGRMFPSWVERTVNGADAYAGATFVALLLKNGYTYDGTDIFISDLTPGSNELTVGVGGYARITITTGVSITRVGSATMFTLNPIVFPTLTATGSNAPRSMILAKSGGSDASSALILQQDFEAASDVTGVDLTITPSPSGLVRYTSTP